MRLYIRRGSLIAESQERVARAKPLTGDMGVSPVNKVPPSPGEEKGARGIRSPGS